ncbi:MAG: DUF502 domain-containing protein [Verrucomicrobiota bacterium]
MSEQWKSIRISFFTGLLVVVPVGASIGLIWWVIKLVTAWLPDQYDSPLWRMAGVVFLVVVTVLVGMLMRKVAGKRLISLGEDLIGQTPLLNKIYPFMKEISHTMLSGQKTMFQRVVLVQFPRRGIYSIGFITSETAGEAQAKTKEQVVNVFVPTTPNPTSGFLVLVPREQVTNMDMSVTEGMKMVISGGAVVPAYLPDGKRP